ncbi:hypothetical protein CPB84DRAFT_1678332 [Gymnopilus junonius]|uniref:Transmembrane protein n=1 Tax=Gymnopilus junonius TaxID=109634 RepID=A0A9P5TPG2_GYMJU|nr:hypothetical protein CPB84DRAFT_1678332 [Gymnopilus junonius]
MPPFRIPLLTQPRHSFNRLRSFHLSPKEAAMAAPQAPTGGTITLTPSKDDQEGSPQSVISPRPTNMAIPLRGSTIVTLAAVACIFFVMCISMAFLGADVDDPVFKSALDTVAQTSPGVVLLGESVDVDVDEPSITIRWSIAACGNEFMLPGSADLHGSSLCGLPSTAMFFYVDSDTNPTATYDPSEIPFSNITGARRSIQNLVQFDSDYVLDVHEARLYPFDTYFLSSTIRAVSFDNQTISIRKAATIALTSSFDIYTTDLESYSTTSNGTQEGSRDIDMHVSRPSSARLFTLMLFAGSWVLTYVTIGHVLIARRLTEVQSVLPHLVSSGAILIAIPQLRNSMPDAPGLDDTIGYFPQMIVVVISTSILLLIIAARELDSIRNLAPAMPARSRASQLIRAPRTPTGKATSMEIAQYEMHRILKQLRGEFVFPPVNPSHRVQPSNPFKTSHRRVKTMSKIMEAGEVSRWSDDE